MEATILEQHPDADITLVRGGGGVFDIAVEDELIFSKHQAGRFPAESEILEALTAQ